MIRNYYRAGQDNSMEAIDKTRRGAWVYVEAPSIAEITHLIDDYELEDSLIADALDEDEMPRVEREDGKTYIFIRFAYKNSRGEIDTAPALIIDDGQHVITVSPVKLPALDWFTKGRTPFVTTERNKLILLICTQISEGYDLYISQTSRKIKTIRSRLRGQGISNQDFIDFAAIEDELSEFLSSLQPTNATLRRLLVGRLVSLGEDDQDLVEDVLLNNEQSIEAIRANLRAIETIREAYSAISAGNLNRTLTVLTIATLVISLPSFAMGIYSMNIRLPAQQTHWIFWVIMGVNVVLMGGVVLIAKRKRIL